MKEVIQSGLFAIFIVAALATTYYLRMGHL